jgi:hypothetical protein
VNENDRLGTAISELRGRALVEGAAKMRLSDKPQRDWAARTIRRLRRELRDERDRLRIPAWASRYGISLRIG